MAEARAENHSAAHASQFATLEQQHETRTFGMWIFLMTEIMLFGGLFTAYVVYRYVYPAGFALGSSRLEVSLGAINTAVLITSSLMMALSVHYGQVGRRWMVVLFLALTVVLGLAFLGIKGLEYYHHYLDQNVPGIRWSYQGVDPNAVQLFFVLYFVMTGLHAVHMVIGCLVVTAMLLATGIGRVGKPDWTPVELTGLYWHLIDIIWIFIFPLLYLIHPA